MIQVNPDTLVVTLARPVDERVRRIGLRMRQDASTTRTRAERAERAAAILAGAAANIERQGEVLETEGIAGVLRRARAVLTESSQRAIKNYWWVLLLVIALVALLALVMFLRQRAQGADDAALSDEDDDLDI